MHLGCILEHLVSYLGSLLHYILKLCFSTPIRYVFLFFHEFQALKTYLEYD